MDGAGNSHHDAPAKSLESSYSYWRHLIPRPVVILSLFVNISIKENSQTSANPHPKTNRLQHLAVAGKWSRITKYAGYFYIINSYRFCWSSGKIINYHDRKARKVTFVRSFIFGGTRNLKYSPGDGGLSVAHRRDIVMQNLSPAHWFSTRDLLLLLTCHGIVEVRTIEKGDWVNLIDTENYTNVNSRNARRLLFCIDHWYISLYFPAGLGAKRVELRLVSFAIRVDINALSCIICGMNNTNFC